MHFRSRHGEPIMRQPSTMAGPLFLTELVFSTVTRGCGWHGGAPRSRAPALRLGAAKGMVSAPTPLCPSARGGGGLSGCALDHRDGARRHGCTVTAEGTAGYGNVQAPALPHRPPLCFLHLKPIVLARCASTDPFPISMQSPIRLGSPIAANVTMRVDS